MLAGDHQHITFSLNECLDYVHEGSEMCDDHVLEVQCPWTPYMITSDESLVALTCRPQVSENGLPERKEILGSHGRGNPT